MNAVFDLFLYFWFGFVVGLSGALIPGPLLAFVVSDSTRKGWKSGLLAAVGHNLVESVIVLIIVVGLAVVMKSMVFQRTVGLIGGACLLIFGALNLRAVVRGELSVEEDVISHYGSILGGIAFTIINPTVPLWWATVGLLMLMDALTTTLLGGVFWVLGHYCSDIGWYSLVSISLSRGKRYINVKLQKLIIAACGMFLIALGVVFLTKYTLIIGWGG